MYKLYLMDGTVIENLRRINPSTFEVDSDNSDLHLLLNSFNLTIAFLEEDDLITDIFVDYDRQNFSWDNGIIRFRIEPYEELHRITNRERKKMKRGGGKCR